MNGKMELIWLWQKIANNVKSSQACMPKRGTAQTRHILGKQFVYAWKVRTHAKHQVSTRLPKPCSWNPFHPANIAKVLPEIYIAHRHSTRAIFAMENHNQRVQEALPLDTIIDGIPNPFYQIRLHGFVSQLAEMILLTNLGRFVIETFFVWLSMCLPGTCVRLLASGRSRLTKCPLTRKLLACSATNCSITFRIHLTIWSTEGLLVDTRSSNRDIAFWKFRKFATYHLQGRSPAKGGDPSSKSNPYPAALQQSLLESHHTPHRSAKQVTAVQKTNMADTRHEWENCAVCLCPFYHPVRSEQTDCSNHITRSLPT